MAETTEISPETDGTTRVRFQYDLRTMLALTALSAWLCGWWGIQSVPILVALAALALIEGGCTKGANLLAVFVRNLFAYLIVTIVFSLFAFGLMWGANPTGWTTRVTWGRLAGRTVRKRRFS